MPKPFEYADFLGNKYVPPTSRYALIPVITYEGKLAYPIYKKKKLAFHPRDQHYEITKEMEYRPDLVSHKFFGAPDFWWKIMEMNRMQDILEFRAGRNIILPGSSLMS